MRRRTTAELARTKPTLAEVDHDWGYANDSRARTLLECDTLVGGWVRGLLLASAARPRHLGNPEATPSDKPNCAVSGDVRPLSSQ